MDTLLHLTMSLYSLTIWFHFLIAFQYGKWAVYVPSSTPNLRFYPCPPGYCRCTTDTSMSGDGTTCVYTYTNSDPDRQCSCSRKGDQEIHIIYVGHCVGSAQQERICYFISDIIMLIGVQNLTYCVILANNDVRTGLNTLSKGCLVINCPWGQFYSAGVACGGSH